MLLPVLASLQLFLREIPFGNFLVLLGIVTGIIAYAFFAVWATKLGWKMLLETQSAGGWLLASFILAAVVCVGAVLAKAVT